MNSRGQSAALARAAALSMPAVAGWSLYSVASWVVQHDSVNYRLLESRFSFLSTAAETVFAVGAVVSMVAGLVLGCPLVIGCFRQARAFVGVTAIDILAGFTLICALGSIRALFFAGFLGTTALLWVVAIVWATASPERTAQQGAAPNSRPPSPLPTPPEVQSPDPLREASSGGCG